MFSFFYAPHWTRKKNVSSFEKTVLGMVFHALPSLFDMFRPKRRGCRCKGLHKPSSKSGEAMSI